MAVVAELERQTPPIEPGKEPGRIKLVKRAKNAEQGVMALIHKLDVIVAEHDIVPTRLGQQPLVPGKAIKLVCRPIVRGEEFRGVGREAQPRERGAQAVITVLVPDQRADRERERAVVRRAKISGI